MHPKNSQAAAIIDLDGTLFDSYMGLGLRKYYTQHRFKLPTFYFFLTTHMTLWFAYKAKLLTREFVFNAWGADLAWLLRGVKVSEAEKIWEWIVENEIMPNLRPEIQEAMQDHRAKGHHLVLLSGSFQPLLEAVAEHMDFDGLLGTQLVQKNGRYVGKIIPPLNIGQVKIERLQDYMAEREGELDLTQSYFYTDSHIDLPLMEMVGYPVAVYPDEKLADLAAERGWQMIGEAHAD